MGRNARRRKDAKLASRTPTTSHVPARKGAAFGALSSVLGGSGLPPASLFRQSCDDCGSADIAWMTPMELASLVGEDGHSTVAEAVDVLGATADAWRCNSCGKWGVLGGGGWGGF